MVIKAGEATATKATHRQPQSHTRPCVLTHSWASAYRQTLGSPQAAGWHAGCADSRMGRPSPGRKLNSANAASPAGVRTIHAESLRHRRASAFHRVSVVNDAVYAPGVRDADVARPSGRSTAAPASFFDRRSIERVVPPGTRPHERRWRDAPIILVERRKGPVWKYGSIALCAALWAQVWLMFRA
jgi:hypothetical protein